MPAHFPRVVKGRLPELLLRETDAGQCLEESPTLRLFLSVAILVDEMGMRRWNRERPPRPEHPPVDGEEPPIWRR